ncbi:MAG: VCBS repeat-containing protein [Chloroflexi bacterium]|nr:VCBS repeat-containing protein [Chloroflexota bacterium]
MRDSSPLLCDLLGNGNKEIVVGGIDGILYAYRPNGNLLWSYNTGVPIYSSPACGDLNGDGNMAVVVGLGNKGSEIGNGGVIAVEGATGALRWRFYTMDYGVFPGTGLSSAVYSTPALGDLYGDGKLQVAFGGWDHNFYLLDPTGKMLWQYPTLDTIWSSPAIADLDNDGILEIITGSDISANAQIGTPNGGYLYVFNRDGTIRWRAYQDQVIYSSPAIGDINGDGYPEIVVGTGDYAVNAGKGYKVYAYNRNGNLLSGWPVNTTGYVFSSPALADLNGDNKPEVIATSEDGKIYAWNDSGTQLWSKSAVATFGGVPNPFVNSPIAADVGRCTFSGASNSASGVPSFLFGLTSEVGVVDSTGTQITDYPGNGTSCTVTIWAEISVLENAVAVGNIDNDDALELVAASGNRYDANRGYLYVWEVANANGAKLPWVMFRQNARRTGVYPRASVLSNIDDAEVSGNTIPSVLPLNYTTTATVSFRNTGNTTWTPATVNLVPFAGDPLATASSYSLSSSVAPGGIATFTIQLRTPNSNTYATTNWRMNRIGASNFGAAASRRVKVGNQPAYYVLRGDGQIYNGGLATNVVTPQTTWTWDAARQLAWFHNNAGGFVFDLYGPWHYAPAAGMTFGPNQDLGAVDTGYTSVGTESLREVDLGGSTYWQMDINGNFYPVGGPALISGLPAAPGNGQAISFALTPNRDGVYMLLRDCSIRRSTSATIVPSTPTFSGQDRCRKIKVTANGLGYYVMDKFGQVYNGGAAQAITPPAGFPSTSEVAADFELTADGKGYYLLTLDGSIYAAGTAASITTNSTPTWTVNTNAGGVARDLVLVDGRLYAGPVLQVSPSAVIVFHNIGSSNDTGFGLTLSNVGGSGPLNWTATVPNKVSLGAMSGALSSSTSVAGTVNANGYGAGTYNLGSIVINGTDGNGQTVMGSPQTIPVTLYVGTYYRLYLPLVIR